MSLDMALNNLSQQSQAIASEDFETESFIVNVKKLCWARVELVNFQHLTFDPGGIIDWGSWGHGPFWRGVSVRPGAFKQF